MRLRVGAPLSGRAEISPAVLPLGQRSCWEAEFLQRFMPMGLPHTVIPGGGGRCARYYAWYEFYPHRLFVLSQTRYPVSRGDELSATVSQANGSVTVTLNDHNQAQGWPFTTTVPARHLAFSSAEWIAEGPSNELTNFGRIDFSAATASTDGYGVTDQRIQQQRDHDGEPLGDRARHALPAATGHKCGSRSPGGTARHPAHCCSRR